MMESIRLQTIDFLKSITVPSLNPLSRFYYEQAIKALENQPKYEKALAEMTKYFRCSKLKGLYLSEEDCHKYKSCEECMIKYFKKKAGLEVSS